MDLHKYIGNRIKHFREQENMTQQDLANYLKTTKQSISRYETGERKTNQDILFELANKFGVSIDDFFPIKNYSNIKREELEPKVKKKLSEVMLTNDKKTEEVISSTGISRGELIDYIKGISSPNNKKLSALALYFNIQQTSTRKNVTEVNTDTKFVYIPILGNIACGDPILADENIESYKERLDDGLPKGELFYLVAKGDSMSPLIPNNSLVLCRAQSDVENGEIAVVLVNGNEEATLKKIRKINNIVILEPVNSDYDPSIISNDNPARIIGKAIEFTSKI